MRDEPRDFDNPFGRRSAGSGSNGAGSNGSSPRGMGTRPVPMDDVRSEPLDLVAVQADDEFINALAGGLTVSAPGYGGYDTDDQVAAMLAAWKADVDADPIPEIDLDAATAAVLAGRRPSGRARHLVPVASAAALIVVAITGVSIGAYDSRPGDALFSISKVLYQEEAASYEALDTVAKSEEKAKQALAVGDKEAAAAAVSEAQAAAGTVLAEHGRGEVVQELRVLEVEVDETIPGVPNTVDEPAPAQAAQGGPGQTTSQQPVAGSTSSSATTTSPQDFGGTGGPGDPGGAGTDPSTDPSTAPAEEPGTGPAPGGSDGPPPEQPGGGTDEPGPGTGSPQGEAPTEPSTGGPKPAPTREKPPEPPAADTSTSDEPARSAPPTTQPPKSGDQGAAGGGISGASMTATGTATPSGQPTTG